MRDRIHVLAQQLLGKASIGDCSLQEVQQLAKSYPYFAPAQFLLLAKLKEDQDPGHTAQLQKSVLYFHNPVGFDYFINSDKFYSPMEESDEESEKESESEELKSDKPYELRVPDRMSIELEADASPYEDEAEEEEEDLVQEENPSEPLPALPGADRIARQLEESNVPETLPAFEPFHTVDYFASQGIKLSQEEAPSDKFGKQLKSFTEWLKTMKRIPASPGTSTPSEQKVAHLAEDSVHDSTVVTEAMAEVWVKQGNHAKAVEVYRKLSLLDPAKSAYFAAKIDNLKVS